MSIDVLSSTISKSAQALEIWKGQSLDIEMEIVKKETQPDGTVKLVAENLTNAVIKFTVRDSPGSPGALILKTTDDVAQVEILSPATDGLFTVHLVPSDTASMEPRPEDYVFDIWIELSSGDRGPVIEVSEFIVREPVTRF